MLVPIGRTSSTNTKWPLCQTKVNLSASRRLTRRTGGFNTLAMQTIKVWFDCLFCLCDISISITVEEFSAAWRYLEHLQRFEREKRRRAVCKKLSSRGVPAVNTNQLRGQRSINKVQNKTQMMTHTFARAFHLVFQHRVLERFFC